ncbi:hypothetical protein BH23BAC2_BH23BAC2_19600 [soil metagenome]
MNMGERKLIESFYTSNFRDLEQVRSYLHPEAELFWNSSAGFHKMGYEEISNLSAELMKAFISLRAEVSHLLKEKNQITIRFTYHVRTVENPDEEIPMAHFIAIWEVKDGKMYKGYQISQQADESPENLSSFLRTNI